MASKAINSALNYTAFLCFFLAAHHAFFAARALRS
jgi:hypothetical protein